MHYILNDILDCQCHSRKIHFIHIKIHEIRYIFTVLYVSISSGYATIVAREYRNNIISPSKSFDRDYLSRIGFITRSKQMVRTVVRFQLVFSGEPRRRILIRETSVWIPLAVRHLYRRREIRFPLVFA